MLRTVDSPKVNEVQSTVRDTSTVSNTMEPRITLRKDARRRLRRTGDWRGVPASMAAEDTTVTPDEKA